MSVVRHEGWHAAQDCMAGTIENNMIAIIKMKKMFLRFGKDLVKRTYPGMHNPGKKEATWAGKTEEYDSASIGVMC